MAKTNIYEYKKFNDIRNGNIDCDLLIIGSSRARNHYNTEIIDSILKVKTHNIGILASFLDYNLMTLKIFLQFNKKPKTVILDMSIYSMQDIDEIRNINQYVGLFDNENVYSTLRKKSISIWFYRYIPLLKYIVNREALQTSLNSFLNKEKNQIGIDKGYSNIDKRLEVYEIERLADLFSNGKETINQDAERINDLKEFINICNKEGINLVLVFSPSYELLLNNVLNKEEVIKKYEEIAVENNIIFMDYSKDDICKNADFFFDCDHLNNKGANVFTEKLIRRLLKEGFCK
ncbi:MAG: hypothetical protein NTY74_11140 [Ignavibacteriae bacterium]|nr:hypothetical protein [Ignavibacteriota bacterium]